MVILYYYYIIPVQLTEEFSDVLDERRLGISELNNHSERNLTVMNLEYKPSGFAKISDNRPLRFTIILDNESLGLSI